MRGFGSLFGGYKIAGFVEETATGAAKFNGLMAHMQTASGATAAQIAKDGETINAMAATGVIANTDLAAGVYNLISAGESEAQALQGVAIATQMVQATAANAADAQATFAEGSRLLGDTMNVWGNRAAAAGPQLQAFADTFSELQTKFSFASLGEVIEAVKIAGPSAHAAGVSFNEMNASIAMLSERGIHAAEAGTAAREVFSKLAIGKKLAGFRVIDPRTGGLDIVQTLERIKGVLPRPGEMRNLILSRMGFDIRDLPSVNLLIENSREMTGIVRDLDSSQGVAAAKQAQRMAAADMQLAMLANKWAVLKDKLGEALLPALTKIVGFLQPIVKAMLEFAGTYTEIAALAMSVVAFASAATIAGGAIQVLGIGTTFAAIGSGMYSAAMGIATAATWLFNTALLANPIGVVIGLVAGLAVATYEIYQHWAGVKAFFSSVWHSLIPNLSGLKSALSLIWGDVRAALSGAVAVIGSFGAAMFTAGQHLMADLGHGIVAAAMAPVHAAEAVAHKIGRFFIGHSPPPEGALRDLNLSREIAVSLKPSPVIAAVRRLAAAAAVIIPVALATPVIPALAMKPAALASIRPAIAMAPPMLAVRAPALAMHAPGKTSSEAPVIHNHNNITVKVAAGRGDDTDIEGRVRKGVEEALERSGHRLSEILRREKATKGRLEY
jgi:TP901 family phage tail tape measure protein